MGVPKKRTSTSRRNRRRAMNFKLTPPNVVQCSKCREPIMSHTVCKACGNYDKKPAIAIGE